MEQVYCPRCGNPNGAANRFCRTCGLSIGQVVRHVESETPERPVVPRRDDDLVRDLRQELVWRAVTGFVTLGLAVPFSALLTWLSLQTLNPLVGLLALVVICFVGVGIRDLTGVYRRLQRPIDDHDEPVGAALAGSTPQQLPGTAAVEDDDTTTRNLDTGAPTRRS